MIDWHPTKNKHLDPKTISKSSDVHVWWICHRERKENECKCVHEYKSVLNHRTIQKYGCPFCRTHASSFCIHNSLEGLHPKIALEWHPFKNGDLKPSMVSRGTSKIVWWRGECGHDFKTSVNSRTTNGISCNVCVNRHKCEKIIYDYLTSIYDVTKEFSSYWCKNDKTGRRLPFDFLVIKFNLIVELDGEQHFMNITQWKTDYKDTQKRDIFKMKCANENNYSMIRIKRYDVYGNLIDWKSILLEHIKSYDKVTNIFITRDDAYKEYIKSVENPIIINPPLLRPRHKKTLKIQRKEDEDEDEDDMIEDVEKVDEEIKKCEIGNELEPEPEPEPELKPNKKIESKTTKTIKHTKTIKEINTTKSTKSAKTADTIQLVKSNKPKKTEKVLKIQKHYD